METRAVDPIGGGFPLLLDAFLFYRLHREWAVRILFLLALLVNLAPALLPMGAGLKAFNSGLYDVGPTSEDLLRYFASALTAFHYDWLDLLKVASGFLAPLVSLVLALVYGALYVDELEARKDGRPVLRTLRGLPGLVLLYVVFQIFSVVSVMFLFIPALILFFALTLAPLLIVSGRRRMTEAVAESLGRTNHFKMRIAFLDLTLLIAMNLPSLLLQLPFSTLDTSGIVSSSISAFFGAMAWMMLGRLNGRLYHVLVTQPQDVIPSSEHPG